MSKQAENSKNTFTPCHIAQCISPFEPCSRHTVPHENRLRTVGDGKTSDATVMQKFNSSI